jgi:hypothetical protein
MIATSTLVVVLVVFGEMVGCCRELMTYYFLTFLNYHKYLSAGQAHIN